MDDSGGIGRIDTSGNVIRLTPINIGLITNAHMMKFGEEPSGTPWDANFENEFIHADTNAPFVIESLQRLASSSVELHKFGDLNCRAIDAKSCGIRELFELVCSLVVRSPRSRHIAVSLADDLRGPLPEGERNRLIAANLRFGMSRLRSIAEGNACIAVLHAAAGEFIFGDGFYTNIHAPWNVGPGAKALVQSRRKLRLFCSSQSMHTRLALYTMLLQMKQTFSK